MVDEAEARHSASAQEQRVLRATVALGPQGTRKASEMQLASGVLIRWHDRLILLTAAHVLRDIPLKEMAMLWPRESHEIIEGSLDRLIEKRGLAPCLHSAPPEPLRYSQDLVHSDRHADVAAVVLEMEPPKGTDPYVLQSDPTAPQPGDHALVAGYAVAAGRFVLDPALPRPAFRRAGISYHSFVVREDEPQCWLDDAGACSFDERIHMTVRYDPLRIRNVDGFQHPRGMSGCGVWVFSKPQAKSAKSKGIWLPEPRLVGLQVSFLEQRRALKVTRIQTVCEMIEPVG